MERCDQGGVLHEKKDRPLRGIPRIAHAGMVLLLKIVALRLSNYCERGGSSRTGSVASVRRDQQWICCSSCTDRKNPDERGNLPVLVLHRPAGSARTLRCTSQDACSYPPVPGRHAHSHAYGRRGAHVIFRRHAGSSAGFRAVAVAVQHVRRRCGTRCTRSLKRGRRHRAVSSPPRW